MRRDLIQCDLFHFGDKKMRERVLMDSDCRCYGVTVPFETVALLAFRFRVQVSPGWFRMLPGTGIEKMLLRTSAKDNGSVRFHGNSERTRARKQ